MPVTNPNFDLFVRRKRLRNVTQRDVGNRLGVARLADISDFENGHRLDLPKGLTRADYERVLREFESEALAREVA